MYESYGWQANATEKMGRHSTISKEKEPGMGGTSLTVGRQMRQKRWADISVFPPTSRGICYPIIQSLTSLSRPKLPAVCVCERERENTGCFKFVIMTKTASCVCV